MAVINLRHILAGLALIAGNETVYAQDSSFVKKKLSENDISAVFSFYTQDGNHSAVTGGTGTEDLQVYSAQIKGSGTRNERHKHIWNIGADFISSASTDRIDFEMSSASKKDLRSYGSYGYERSLKNGKYLIGGELMLSIESDYFSRGTGLWFTYNKPDQTKSMGVHVRAFFDDLRWGRLQKPFFINPQYLIYPEELRGTKWFDIHNRNSYNFSFNYRMDLNRRMSWSLYPTYVYQEGLLSTPFHRVYFMESNLARVENLPNKRSQYAIGTELNAFIGERWVTRTFYQYFTDEFGIQSHTLKIEAPFKLKSRYSLGPFVRFYQQTGTRYFKPYKEHSINDVFYTSDYDLSSFWSGSAGINLRMLITSNKPMDKYSFQVLNLRYWYYYRQDGLRAHTISCYFNLERRKERELLLK